MMKKLTWSGLDFLRRDRGAIARESENNSHLGLNQWSSESTLHNTEHVSESLSECNKEKRSSNKQRLSLLDLLHIKRSPSEKSRFSETKSRSGILDTLKRKFKGNFKITRTEHSQVKHGNKRHSFSLSISSIAEEPLFYDRETLPKSKTLPVVHDPFRLCSLPSSLRQLQKGCHTSPVDLSTVSENQDVIGSPNDSRYTVPPEDEAERSNTEQTVEEKEAIVHSPIKSSNSSNLAWELFKLVKFGWYWGRMTRSEAEQKLANQPDGAFLVRDSSDDCHLLSLSFRSYGRTLHTRIEHSNGCFSFYAYPEAEQHNSVGQLIEHLMDSSRSGIFCYSRSRSPGSPSFPVRLTKPVSRFSEVLPLQYMCRFVIRQYVRMDHIEALPLPESLKLFIVQGNS